MISPFKPGGARLRLPNGTHPIAISTVPANTAADAVQPQEAVAYFQNVAPEAAAADRVETYQPFDRIYLVERIEVG